MKSLLLIATLLTCVGCQSAELAVSYPMTGVHVVAKFQASDLAARMAKAPTATDAGVRPEFSPLGPPSGIKIASAADARDYRKERF